MSSAPFGLLALLALLCALTSGAKAATSVSVPQWGKVKGASILVDSNHGGDLSNALQGALSELRSVTISARGGSNFDKIFSGTSASAVQTYLEQRIHYLVYAHEEADGGSDNSIEARNESVIEWFYSLLVQKPEQILYAQGPQPIVIEDPRVGIVEVGDYFIHDSDLGRLITLVHEARHSDCTGGTYLSDIPLVEQNKPITHACGHLHELCPSWHPHAGQYECDFRPWGAYAVELVFVRELENHCNANTQWGNCTQDDSNVLLGDDQDHEPLVIDSRGLFGGKYGPPDMSSSLVVYP